MQVHVLVAHADALDSPATPAARGSASSSSSSSSRQGAEAGAGPSRGASGIAGQAKLTLKVSVGAKQHPLQVRVPDLHACDGMASAWAVPQQMDTNQKLA